MTFAGLLLPISRASANLKLRGEKGWRSRGNSWLQPDWTWNELENETTAQPCGCVQNSEPRRQQNEFESAVQRGVWCTWLAEFLVHAWRQCVGGGSFSHCGQTRALRPTIWKTSAVPCTFPNTGRQPHTGRRRWRTASDWTANLC